MIRETANSTNLTQACIPAPLWFCYLTTLMHVATSAATIKYSYISYIIYAIYVTALRVYLLLQIYKPENYKQLQTNTRLLAAALHAAHEQIVISADMEMTLAVFRGMEVLSRVRELLDKQVEDRLVG